MYQLNPANSLCEAMGGGKERVAPGCLSPGASLRVAKRPCGNGSPPPNACTSETQKLLEVLAATLRSLSDEDRARLTELIQRED